MPHEHHNPEADLSTEEHKAVRDLEAFLQGSGISQEELQTRLDALTLPAWYRVQLVLRARVGDSRERQRRFEESLERLKRPGP